MDLGWTRLMPVMPRLIRTGPSTSSLDGNVPVGMELCDGIVCTAYIQAKIGRSSSHTSASGVVKAWCHRYSKALFGPSPTLLMWQCLGANCETVTALPEPLAVESSVLRNMPKDQERPEEMRKRSSKGAIGTGLNSVTSENHGQHHKIR